MPLTHVIIVIVVYLDFDDVKIEIRCNKTRMKDVRKRVDRREIAK